MKRHGAKRHGIKRLGAKRYGRRGRAAGAVAAATVLALLSSACTGGGDGDGGPAAAGEAGTPGEIVIASGRDVTGKGGIRQQLIRAWNKKQEKAKTGYSARLVELPGSADQQRSQLLGALQSGSAEYDVVNLDVTWVPEFASAGLVRRLDGKLLDDDVIPSVAETARWKGEVYSAPFNSDVGLLYYRRDYLKKARVNDTDLGDTVRSWKDLKSLILTLDAGKAMPRSYEKGWTAQLAPYEGRTVSAIEAFASAGDGAGLVDGEGRYTADREQLEAGIAELRDRVDGAYTLDDAARSYEADSLRDFANGRTAFLRHWPYAYRTLHQSLTPEQLGVAPLPGKAVLGGQNLAVARTSQHAKAATDLVTFLTGKESERCLLEAGFAATRASVYTEPEPACGAARTPGDDPGSGSGSGSGSGEGADRIPRDAEGRPAYAARTLVPALRDAVQRPRTPLYGAFTQTFSARLERLFSGKPVSGERLADSLDAALREALPGGG